MQTDETWNIYQHPYRLIYPTYKIELLIIRLNFIKQKLKARILCRVNLPCIN